jgi:SAM-dependent methyltransferase
MVQRVLTLPDSPLLDLQQWARPANATERTLLADVAGPVLDIGCGPGRLVSELVERGVSALGIDAAPAAVAHAQQRGVRVLTRSVFDQLPGEGTWKTLLLVDGNIGIGGDPLRLLARVHDLLAPDGVALVEVEPPGTAARTSLVRIQVATHMVGLFPWSRVGTDDIASLAEAAGLRADQPVEIDGRWFARLRHRQLRSPAARPRVAQVKGDRAGGYGRVGAPE